MAHRNQLSCLNQGVPVAYHSHSLTPSSHTPLSKMSQPQRTSSQDSSSEGIRKRVCKACDRCRLKKSKCDGSSPCTRCKSDNAVCVFGERKKSQDKVYPKGYVEQLEGREKQLVSGLVMLYEKLEKAGAWEGPSLELNVEGKPYTHYILQALDLLETRPDGSIDDFEDDHEKLQQKLLDAGAGLNQTRRASFGSDSEHSQHSHARTHSHGTPMIAHHAPTFKEDFKFEAKSEPCSPPAYNVAARSNRHSFQALPAQPSPLQQSSPLGEDTMFQTPWPQYDPANDPKYALQPNYAIQAPQVQHNMALSSFGQWDNSSYPPDMEYEHIPGWQDMPVQNPYNGTIRPTGIDFSEMDFDYNSYVAVQT